MTVKRVFSKLVIKELDEDQRVLRGVASTPSTDRMGDIVQPKGARFSLPLPLLWQHDHDQPIGSVTAAKVTDNGIEIEAKLVQVDSPPRLAARLEEAWQSIKTGLVRGLSIGFRPIKYSFLEDGDGVEYSEWDFYELSAVTIPANAEASITAIKRFSEEAATGDDSEKLPAPRQTIVKILPKHERKTAMNYQEMLKRLQDTRAEKEAERDALQKTVSEEGRTKTASEREAFDTLNDEIKAIDLEMKDLRDLEAQNKANAKPVDGGDAPAAAKQYSGITLKKAPEKLDPGIAVARIARAKAVAAVKGLTQREAAAQLYGEDSTTYEHFAKAAVAPATTTTDSWAGNLVGSDTSVFADFVEYLRPQTILGRFGSGGIPSLRNVGFRVPLIGQTSGGSGYWVGEGDAKPLTKFDFSRTTLEPLKVANIAVASKEVLEYSNPSADAIIRDSLVAALRERLDIDFIDPTKSASSGVSPASITNGVTPIPSDGVDADGVRADIRAIFSAFIAANNAPTSGVWIMGATQALSLSLMMNPLGQSEFPGVGMNGGTLFGLPVIVSEHVPAGTVVLVNAQDIYLGDEGGFSVDFSREASLQMDSSPDNPTSSSTVLVSLWQRNLVGFLAERTISWARRRTSAVQVLTGVNWGGEYSS